MYTQVLTGTRKRKKERNAACDMNTQHGKTVHKLRTGELTGAP